MVQAFNQKIGLLRLAFVLYFFAFSFVAFSQSQFSNENDLKKEAKSLFEKENYKDAFPLFSQLLSNYPKDANYNYQFGVCLLFTTEDKEKPLSYLEYASKQSSVDKTVFYFLGLAYHINYRFDDAIKNYNRFKKEGSSGQQKKYNTDNQIAMCRNGKTLLKNITDLRVLEKKRVESGEFFRSYDLGALGGKLIKKPDEFQSALDIKKGEQSVIYLGKNNEVIYYASYGKDGKNGKDIFMVKKDGTGEWGTAKNLGPVINTPFDEDYPFVHPNGKILYFSSKGHNSMGGFDIFKSYWDASTDAWGPPVNLDFAINSPGDDLMFVTDSLDKVAYFSSNRVSDMGTVDVYKINTDRKPLDLAFINGTVGKNPDGQIIKSKITVKNASSGELLGIYSNDPVDGHYSISVPPGGKLLMTVESDGINPVTTSVDIPPSQSSFKPLRQEINYDASSKKLQLTNNFNATEDENNYLLALDLIKEKSKLNVTPVDSGSLVDKSAGMVAADTNKLSAVSQLNGKEKQQQHISNEALVNLANEDAMESLKESDELRKQADNALSFANEKSALVQQKYKEADALEASGDLAKAKSTREEADKLSFETVTAFNFAKKLEKDAASKLEESTLSKQYVEELAKASTANSTVALKQLAAQKQQLESLNQQPTGSQDVTNRINLEIKDKETEIEDNKKASRALASEISDIDTELTQLKTQSDNEKSEKIKAGLVNQLNGIQESKQKKADELTTNETRLPQLEKELANLKDQAALINGMIPQLNAAAEGAKPKISAVDKQKLADLVGDFQKKSGPIGSKAFTVDSVRTQVAAVVPAAGTVKAMANPFGMNGADFERYKQLNTEAESANAEALKVRSAGYAKADPVEKNDLLNQANGIEKNAVLLKQHADSISGYNAKNTFEGNSDRLDMYAKSLSNNGADEVVMAGLMADEAKSYFDKAKGLRDKLTAAVSYATVQELTSAAEENETLALDKQQKSMQLYLKLKPDTSKFPVVKRPKVVKPVAAPVTPALAVVAAKPAALDTVRSAKAIPVPAPSTPVAVAPVAPVAPVAIKPVVLTSEEKKEIRNSKSFKDYAALRSLSDSAFKAAKIYNDFSELMNTYLVAKNKSQDSVMKLIESAPANQPIPGNLLKASAQLKLSASSLQHKVDSFKVLSNKMEDIRQSAMKDAYALLNQMDQNLSAKIVQVFEHPDVPPVVVASAVKPGPSKQPEVKANEKGKDKNNEKGKEREKEKDRNKTKTKPVQEQASIAQPTAGPNVIEPFTVATASVYSNNNPIPIDAPMPEGLIYKVQIGAFKKPIKQDAFKGMKPLMGERTPKGFIRYTAGIFKELDKANGIKGQIQQMGYKDAFVVAFLNGKRVGLNEAARLTGTSGAVLAAVDTVQKPIGATVQQSAAVPSGGLAGVQQGAVVPTGGVEPAIGDIAKTTGLIYTVQVGVYSQALPKGKLNNLDSLNVEYLPNGLKRYTKGLYKDIGQASDQKDLIVSNGIKDAFIIVYKDGKRVTGNEIVQKANAVNKISPTGISAPAAANGVAISAKDLHFKVQLGAFSNDVPVEIANKFFKLAGKGITLQKEDGGLTVYNLGNEKTFENADKLKQFAIENGVEGAFVVAYLKDKKITLEAAKSIATK